MSSAGTPTPPIGRPELPGMLATLCYYHDCFGPYHPQTLHMMTHVGIAYSQAGERVLAKALLERAIRDLARVLGPDHDLRLRALEALRDLLSAQGDFERAVSVQKELLACRSARLGVTHPDTLAAKGELGKLWLETSAPGQ